ncbi:transcription factor Adf-1-like isoform X4 [Halichondria panicea]|uniref:transcription factor Adf-1-like isoform X4 n=1 Tax=Halichondria panicea TaxID=6063 RepID=UPI00312B2D04
MEIDKRKLIEAIEGIPCLWALKDKDYKDAKAREEAWKEVASQMGNAEAVERFITKWKSLRDRFVREIKRLRLEQAKDPNTTYQSQWLLFDNMLFLQHCIRHRESTTGLEESMRVQPFDADRSSTVSLTGHLAIPAKLRCSKGNRTNETLILLQVAEPPMLAPSLLSSITDPPSPSHSHSSDDSSSSSPPTKRKRRPEANKTSEILLKILSEVSNKEKELDEEALFALQVAANLRRLSSRQKATAKIKIQQVLLEIEFPTET